MTKDTTNYTIDDLVKKCSAYIDKEEEIDLFDLFFKYEKMFSVTDVTDDNNVIFLLNYITTYEQLICLLSKIKSSSKRSKIKNVYY